jgi:AcrR family transcriptional regulator
MAKQVKRTKVANGGAPQNIPLVKIKKAAAARQKILTAARTIFARYPYHSASIRMVGNEGGFDHPIINYYFPTKAALFEAVLAEICEEFFQANLSWFSGLERMTPLDGLSLYIDRFLDYNCKNPTPLRIIMLNFVQSNTLDELPGHQHIHKLLQDTRRTFEEKSPLKATPEAIGMFIHSFNMLVMNYMGAGDCQAQVLGMEPGSNAYRVWVKDALIFIFYSHLNKLIFPDRNDITSNKEKLVPIL